MKNGLSYLSRKMMEMSFFFTDEHKMLKLIFTY